MEMTITIVAGVSVFAASQFLLIFVLQPLKEIKTSISEATFYLLFYADIYSNMNAFGIGDPKVMEMKDTLRKIGSRLHSKADLIPLYDILRNWVSTPSRSNMADAARNLIALSNVSKEVSYKSIEATVSSIKQALNIQS